MLAKLTTILLLATLWALPVATQDDTDRDDTRRERPGTGPATTTQPLRLPALDRRAHPGCLPLERWKATHPAGPAGVPGGFVVVRLDGSVVHMSTEETWRRMPPEPGADADASDDVWAIGACPR